MRPGLRLVMAGPEQTLAGDEAQGYPALSSAGGGRFKFFGRPVLDRNRSPLVPGRSLRVSGFFLLYRRLSPGDRPLQNGVDQVQNFQSHRQALQDGEENKG